MKIRLLTALFFASMLFGGFAANAFAQTLPSTTLHFGDTSQQVLFLQQVLNRSPDTAVATSGAGSPGMESTYFGAKTLSAVERYQAKYSAQILIPAGLTAPSGVVGPLTLAMLQKTAVATGTGTSTVAVSSSTVSTLSSVVASASPMEQYIAAVTQLGLKQGYASSTLALIAQSIRATSASTSDLQTQFYKEQQALYLKQTSMELAKPLAVRVLDKIVASIANIWMPEQAEAQAVTGLPFGGYVSYVNPCTCTPNVVQIFVALPAPTPTSNLLLDYVLGSEGFNWHTLPAPGVATLGLYAPGAPTCFEVVPDACVPLPAVGTITPEVGSSPLP